MNSIKLWNKMDAIFMIPEIVKHLIFADFYLTFQKKTKQWICCFIKSYCLLYMDKFKKSYENNKYKISALTLKEELELLEGSYSVSDIHNSFGYLFKKHGA